MLVVVSIALNSVLVLSVQLSNEHLHDLGEPGYDNVEKRPLRALFFAVISVFGG